MSKVERKYVVPGDVIAEGDYVPVSNAYSIGEKVYAMRVGLCELDGNKVKVIPLSGPYVPKPDDVVIGVVTDVSAFAWTVDINSFFPAFLPASSVYGRRFSAEKDDLRNKFDVGDTIIALVAAFDRSKDPMLSVSGPRLGLAPAGYVVKIEPVKVPRLIGRRGSMSKMIEEASGCKIIIGQNGYIIISGPQEGAALAMEAINMVEDMAHMSGLTEKIERFLADRLGLTAEQPAEQAQAPVSEKAAADAAAEPQEDRRRDKDSLEEKRE
ncbi:MAG TPA: exosome complex RNA-binding protein Rrp4 [Conexivisphaerales archaeon]|nr:exosome complex RNA-binding protein Rrp4 [Conexivisphaerales archaeon]